MDNDSGALILLIILIVFAIVLMIIKLAQFINNFSREKHYLLTEMRRAADKDEYCYWRRELRCHYLCAIPFVTERNVMKVYRIFFHREKRAKGRKNKGSILFIIAPSVIGICICAIGLCGTSWAWFTASNRVGTAASRSATFQIANVRIVPKDETGKISVLEETGKYKAELKKNTYTLSFQVSENSTSNGYCCITVFEKGNTAGTAYYTENIEGNYTVHIITDKEITVEIEPIWGNVKKRISGNIVLIGSGGTIGNAKQSTSKKQSNSVSDEPSEKSVSIQGSSSTESANVTSESELSATAPTEPETADTKPTSAPEITAPESTTAADSEPSAAEESENN